jgi:hypothetical protein
VIAFKSFLAERYGPAAQKARSMGLTYLGFGRWGTDKHQTYQQIGTDKLEPVEQQFVGKYHKDLRKSNAMTVHDDLNRISKEERNALKQYSSTADKHINRVLTDHPNTDDLDQTVAKTYVPYIDSAMQKHPIEKEMTLYRGISPRIFEQMKKMGVGGVYSNPAYVSTSTDSAVAHDFSQKAIENAISTMMIIHARPGTANGIPMEKVSRYGGSNGEDEVLLDRNTSFKIIRVEESGNRKRIVVETI